MSIDAHSEYALSPHNHTQVTNVRVGDAVVPLDSGMGTWRQAGVVEAAALHAVPKTLTVEAAATMSIK